MRLERFEILKSEICILSPSREFHSPDPSTLACNHHFAVFRVADKSNVFARSAVTGVPHVIVPEDLWIADIPAVELGTVPAVHNSHRALVAFCEVGCAPGPDVVAEEKFLVVDRPAVGFGTEPAIFYTKRLSQLKPNSKVHNGKVLRTGHSSKSRAESQWGGRG